MAAAVNWILNSRGVLSKTPSLPKNLDHMPGRTLSLIGKVLVRNSSGKPTKSAKIPMWSGSIGRSSTTVQHQVQTPGMRRFLTLLAPEAVVKTDLSGLKFAKVGDAGSHHVQLHLDKVIFYAARFSCGKDFLPIE